jgi:hypothetical protein
MTVTHDRQNERNDRSTRCTSTRRGDNRRTARRNPRRKDHGRAGRPALYRVHAPITASQACCCPRMALPFRKSPAPSAPLRFPIETVKASTMFPDRDKNKGPPFEFGPHGINGIRSERAAAIRHDRRQAQCRSGQRHQHLQHPRRTLDGLQGQLRPSSVQGPLPKGTLAACEFFRQQPEALERAAELDAKFGRNPDLDKYPMYGVFFSFKDAFHRHALYRWWRRGLRHGFSCPGSCAGRSAPQEGRVHYNTLSSPLFASAALTHAFGGRTSTPQFRNNAFNQSQEWGVASPGNHATACLLTLHHSAMRNRALALS